MMEWWTQLALIGVAGAISVAGYWVVKLWVKWFGDD